MNTYIPLRKVAESTGANVEWDNINKKVIITTLDNDIMPVNNTTPVSTSENTMIKPVECKVYYTCKDTLRKEVEGYNFYVICQKIEVHRV